LEINSVELFMSRIFSVRGLGGTAAAIAGDDQPANRRRSPFLFPYRRRPTKIEHILSEPITRQPGPLAEHMTRCNYGEGVDSHRRL
jgi:hypothetical protein